MYLTIYLTGVIITWVILKIVRTRDKEANTWGFIRMCVVISLFSWAGLIVSSIILADDYFKTNDPPKWL